MRQQRPKSLVEAVRATIELESYLPKNELVAPMQGVASVRDNQSLVSVIEKLADRVEKLEGKLNDRTVSRKQQQPSRRPRPDYKQPVICHRCRSFCKGLCPGSKESVNRRTRSHVINNQVHDQDINISEDNNAHTITINSVSNYSVDVYVGNVLVSFLVDTGAAVSLIRGDI